MLFAFLNYFFLFCTYFFHQYTSDNKVFIALSKQMTLSSCLVLFSFP